MKNAKKLALMLIPAASFMFAPAVSVVALSSTSYAQKQKQTTVGTLLRGLINVNVQNVALNVETGDITLVQVQDVLNNARVTVVALNDAINDNEIASRNSVILTNLLRNAELITNNQVVVGVLSGGILVIQ